MPRRDGPDAPLEPLPAGVRPACRDLTAVGVRGGRVACVCACGAAVDVQACVWRRGDVGRCPDCRARAAAAASLVGRRFGKLVARELLAERSPDRQTVYRCACDCGRWKRVKRSNLLGHGPSKTRSCGKCPRAG